MFSLRRVDGCLVQALFLKSGRAHLRPTSVPAFRIGAWDVLAKAMEQMQSPVAAIACDPALAETARRARKICVCNAVDLGTIEDAIYAHGLRSVAAVREHTNAAGGCCQRRIEGILVSEPSAMSG